MLSKLWWILTIEYDDPIKLINSYLLSRKNAPKKKNTCQEMYLVYRVQEGDRDSKSSYVPGLASNSTFLLPQPPHCWDHRCAHPHLVFVLFFKAYLYIYNFFFSTGLWAYTFEPLHQPIFVKGFLR
jgi:hypothetical protein